MRTVFAAALALVALSLAAPPAQAFHKRSGPSYGGAFYPQYPASPGFAPAYFPMAMPAFAPAMPAFAPSYGCYGSAAPMAPSYGCYGSASPFMAPYYMPPAAPMAQAAPQEFPVALIPPLLSLLNRLIDRGALGGRPGDGGTTTGSSRELDAIRADVRDIKRQISLISPTEVDNRLDKIKTQIDDLSISTKKALRDMDEKMTKRLDLIDKDLGEMKKQIDKKMDKP